MRHILVPLLILLFVACAGDKAALAEKDEELVQLRNELDKLDKRLAAENKLRKQAESERDKLKEDLNAAEQRAEAFKNEVDRLRSQPGNYVIGNRISLPNNVLFSSGSSNLSTQGQAALDAVWELLAKYPDREILVAGHTDNMPIGKNLEWKYSSNWDLAAERAVTVMDHLEANGRINAARFRVVAYGPYQPITDNSTKAERSENRRVEIIIGNPIP